MKRKYLVSALAVAGGVAGLLWVRSRATRAGLPVKIWRAPLAAAYGDDVAEELLGSAQVTYSALLAHHPAEEQPALRDHARRSILPGLALYQALLERHGGDRQAALAAIEPVFRAWSAALNSRRMRLLRSLPGKFTLFRLAYMAQMRAFPKQGWEFAQIENSPQRIAFDAHSCFYLRTLTAYGAPELTASFCSMDDYMAEMFPPEVSFRRTKTLGQGDDCCDFRYELTTSRETVPALNLELLACPKCGEKLALANGRDALTCPACDRAYPIIDGIPHFIEQDALTGQNRRFAYLYDWFSWVYRLYSRVAFRFIGLTEEAGRREVLDRLVPNGGRVLEVSIGPGVNLPYLVGRPDVGEVHGLDISLGQLKRCRSYARGKGWRVPLYLGNAEELPFADATFDSVFHIGGINFFNDKATAIREMVRVAKPGARILISDETERGAKSYEWSLPGFSQSFKEGRPPVSAPVEAVPAGMEALRVYDVWNGWMYCMEFRTPRE